MYIRPNAFQTAVMDSLLICQSSMALKGVYRLCYIWLNNKNYSEKKEASAYNEKTSQDILDMVYAVTQMIRLNKKVC